MSDHISYKSNDRVTTRSLKRFKKEGKKIAVLTAYDFPTAKILDSTGIDCILVGDSAGTVVAGHVNTLPITMDEMIFLTSAVSRASAVSYPLKFRSMMSDIIACIRMEYHTITAPPVRVTSTSKPNSR